jgi:hypothetical protein
MPGDESDNIFPNYSPLHTALHSHHYYPLVYYQGLSSYEFCYIKNIFLWIRFVPTAMFSSVQQHGTFDRSIN